MAGWAVGVVLALAVTHSAAAPVKIGIMTDLSSRQFYMDQGNAVALMVIETTLPFGPVLCGKFVLGKGS